MALHRELYVNLQPFFAAFKAIYKNKFLSLVFLVRASTKGSLSN